MTDFLPDNFEDNLIYLAGMARSGTTIISRALDLHPEVYTPADETLFVEHVWTMRDHSPDLLLRRTLFGSSGFQYTDIRRLLNQLPAISRPSLARRIEKAFRNLSFRDLYSLYPHIYFLANPQGKEAAKLRFWKDKSTVREGFGLVAEHFPRTKFIFIVRNPLAAVKSQIINGFGLRNRDISIDEIQACNPIPNACYWYEMNKQVDAFHKSDQYDSLLVRYEDFVSDPYETIARLFDHIGLSQLDREFVDEFVLKQKAVLNDPDKQAQTRSGVHTDSLNSHQTILSPAQTELVSAITSPLAQAYDYDLPLHPNIVATMLQTPFMSPRQKASFLTRRLLPIIP